MPVKAEKGEINMGKRCLLVLVFAMVIAGAVFAQSDFDSMPKNTITVDLGPTYIGAIFGLLGDLMGDEGASSSGFGIGVQYERQIQEKMSLGGRFAYLAGGFGSVDEDLNQRSVSELKLSSFSLEGHFRFYPAGRIFFFDAMLGYASLSVAFSDEVIETDKYGKKTKESASISAYRNYIKYGSKIGWRIDFGKPGGFVFEPSFGYYGGIGLGDTIGKMLAKDADLDVDVFNDMFRFFEEFIFISGPRVSLSFGWRF